MPLTAFERLKINFFKRLEVTVMSKNQEERANYYLYIDGQAVPVSEEIYRVYQHYERKEEYFSYDLKREKFQKETASFLPSREDSYERLLEKDRQFAASGQSVEKMVVSSVWLEEILSLLTDEERQIIEQLYIFGHTEREACSAMNLVLSTFQRRKKALLQKLCSLLEKIYKKPYEKRVKTALPTGK